MENDKDILFCCSPHPESNIHVYMSQPHLESRSLLLLLVLPCIQMHGILLNHVSLQSCRFSLKDLQPVLRYLTVLFFVILRLPLLGEGTFRWVLRVTVGPRPRSRIRYAPLPRPPLMVNLLRRHLVLPEPLVAAVHPVAAAAQYAQCRESGRQYQCLGADLGFILNASHLF